MSKRFYFEMVGNSMEFSKKSHGRIRPKIMDIIIFVAIIIIAAGLALLLAGGESDNLTVEIEHNGEVIYSVELSSVSEPETITVEGDYTTVVVIEHDGVYVSESDCPNQVCVYTGKIDKAGQSIICLPNRLVVTIIGTDTIADAFTG